MASSNRRDCHQKRAQDHSRFKRFCIETIWSFTFLRAQILDVAWGPYTTLWNSGALRSLKQVQVVITESFSGDGIDYPMFYQSPNVAHIYGRVYDDANQVFVSQNLVTLSFETTSTRYHSSLVWNLPSLRHLRIGHSSIVLPAELTDNILLPLLRLVGGHLLSLWIDTWDNSYEMPPEVWCLCPVVERFHSEMQLVVLPPPSYPLRTLIISMQDFAPSYSFYLKLPHLQRVVVEARWLYVNESLKQEIQHNDAWRHGVVLEDLDGNPLRGPLRL